MSEIDQALAEAAEKIRREAYAQGWHDAIAAVNKAVSDMGAPTMPESRNSSPPISTKENKEVTAGSTPFYVLQAVRKFPGMSSSEIVGKVQEGGHQAPETSIRTTIFRLKDRKFIVSRHAKWFPL